MRSPQDREVDPAESQRLQTWMDASAQHVVRQQARGGGQAISHPLHETLPDIFTQSAVHTVAVKLSYWFGSLTLAA